MLNEIVLHFHGSRVMVCDTANSSNSTYTINTEKNMLTIKSSGWTERARMWDDDAEAEAANLVDNFIHSVIRNPIPYELQDDLLTLYYNNEKYNFTPSERQ